MYEIGYRKRGRRSTGGGGSGWSFNNLSNHNLEVSKTMVKHFLSFLRKPWPAAQLRHLTVRQHVGRRVIQRLREFKSKSTGLIFRLGNASFEWLTSRMTHDTLVLDTSPNKRDTLAMRHQLDGFFHSRFLDTRHTHLSPSHARQFPHTSILNFHLIIDHRHLRSCTAREDKSLHVWRHRTPPQTR